MKPARLIIWLFLMLPTAVAFCGESHGQNSSLFSRDLSTSKNAPTTLETGSWYYRKLPPPKKIAVHDIVMIRVDEKAQAIAEGDIERRKNASFDAVLSDWVVLDGLKSIRPSPQSAGDPRVKGQLNSLYRAEADMETIESLKFDIAAEVVDIRPNGNLVLEAHKVIRNNEETWEYSLTGICRAEDVAPNNLVLSDHLAELSIYKRERGQVRDGYNRGWLLRWWDTFHAF